MSTNRDGWEAITAFAQALRHSLTHSSGRAGAFYRLWTDWLMMEEGAVGLGDLLPHGGRPLRSRTYGDAGLELYDLVHPDDL